MDEILEKANELSTAIQNTPEVKEYLHLKELIEKDESLKQMRNDIALLASENKLEERDNLLKIYNSNPLVNNYEIAKENVLALLKTIADILR